MTFIRGDWRKQGTMFPPPLDELISAGHFRRVIDRFLSRVPLLHVVLPG